MEQQYVGLRHFRYSGQVVEPGRVFPKLAVRNNLWLEQHGYVELFRDKQATLVDCQQCPAKFISLHDMQRHVDNNTHQDGRVVASAEGIRPAEQEKALDEIIADMPKEKPGFVEANASGEMSREPKQIKRRR
ncbi:hypothetical protein LCGC14_1856040 [marine sediment metagenome]|uniref:C2H2-type domain-containing protein n=1 Tax=marine sediment metagenome TaxID=412755 RepID=A0A0F9G9D4_9ZZZZ